MASLELHPIGVIRTPFSRSAGTPIQSSVSDAQEGRVEVFPQYEPGLKDIEGFERLWLLYCFDRAADPRMD